MVYLANFYKNNNDLEKAKKYYKEAYKRGSIKGGYGLAYVIEDINDKKLGLKNTVTIGRSVEAKKILEHLSENGDEFSTIDLSFYYSEGSKKIRDLNIVAGINGNATAYHNLGVYYYDKNNKQKSKFWFRQAEKYGYKLEDKYKQIK